MELRRRIRRLEAAREDEEALDAEIESLYAEIEAREGPEEAQRLLAEAIAEVDRALAPPP